MSEAGIGFFCELPADAQFLRVKLPPSGNRRVELIVRVLRCERRDFLFDVGGRIVDVEWFGARLFEMNGWKGTWRNGIYSYHPLSQQRARSAGGLCGPSQRPVRRPSGPIVVIEAGDVAVLPAGTAHRCVEPPRICWLSAGIWPASRTTTFSAAIRMSRWPPNGGLPPYLRRKPTPYGANGPLFEHWRE